MPSLAGRFAAAAALLGSEAATRRAPPGLGSIGSEAFGAPFVFLGVVAAEAIATCSRAGV